MLGDGRPLEGPNSAQVGKGGAREQSHGEGSSEFLLILEDEVALAD